MPGNKKDCPRIGRWLGLLGVCLLTACAAVPDPVDRGGEPPVQVEASMPPDLPGPAVPGWRDLVLPGKRPTHYRLARMDGRPAIHAHSERAASMLRRKMSVAPTQLGDFRFSWWVPGLIPGAVPGERDSDDAPVRVVLAFDGDHAKLSLRERLQFDLAEALTGERPPYATLMYVWDPRRPPDDIIMSPRTERIRKVVVESGGARLKRWLDYRRDVLADFRRVYGEEPGTLLAVGVMTDSDNTQSRAEAWYGEPTFAR